MIYAGDICNSVEDSISWKKTENLHVMSCFDISVHIIIKHNKMIPTQCSHTFSLKYYLVVDLFIVSYSCQKAYVPQQELKKFLQVLPMHFL